MLPNLKSYRQLLLLPSFKERFEYLKIGGLVGKETFGGRRYLNQKLYHTPEWERVRNIVISRDRACDLALPDLEIHDKVYVHHINPITIEDILERADLVLDPENLITVSFLTHQAIHYGSFELVNRNPIERKPNDTIPWR